MDIVIASAADAASITVDGIEIEVREGGLVTVTAEQFAMLAHLDPVIIGRTADEATPEPPVEALPVTPDSTTAPARERAQQGVKMTLAQPNGAVSTLYVGEGQVEQFKSQGWTISDDATASQMVHDVTDEEAASTAAANASVTAPKAPADDAAQPDPPTSPEVAAPAADGAPGEAPSTPSVESSTDVPDQSVFPTNPDGTPLTMPITNETFKAPSTIATGSGE